MSESSYVHNPRAIRQGSAIRRKSGSMGPRAIQWVLRDGGTSYTRVLRDGGTSYTRVLRDGGEATGYTGMGEATGGTPGWGWLPGTSHGPSGTRVPPMAHLAPVDCTLSGYTGLRRRSWARVLR